MLKKIIALTMVVAMLAGILIMPVSAAARYSTIGVRDYVTGESAENGTVYLHHSMGNFTGDSTVAPYIRVFDSNGAVVNNNHNWGLMFTASENEYYDICFSLFSKAYNLLDITDIADGTTFTINFDWAINPVAYATPGLYFIWYYYNAYGENLGFYKHDVGRLWADQDDSGKIPDYMEHTFTIEKPEGAVRLGLMVWLYDFKSLKANADVNIYVENWRYTVGVPEYKWEQEQEKNEALDSGDDNIGEILDVIPNESEGFANALKEFTGAMSYEGTTAILPIPALVLPGIEGLIPETVLLDAQQFDLGSYIQMMPEWLLLLVQSLLTIALIVYCFKELYDTIAYVMTLRKGA